MKGTNDAFGIYKHKTKNTDMYLTLLRKKENLPLNPNNLWTIYIHMI